MGIIVAISGGELEDIKPLKNSVFRLSAQNQELAIPHSLKLTARSALLRARSQPRPTQQGMKTVHSSVGR